jgi:two-component system, sensor histidine kinase
VTEASPGFSLTGKVITGLVSVITLLGLLIIGVVYQFTRGALRDQFDLRALAIATNLSDAAAAHVVRKNVLELSGLLRNYALVQGVEYAFIEDAKGAVIAHTLGTFPAELKPTALAEGRLRPQSRTLRFEGKIVYETSVPILGGQVGTAHLGIRRDFVEEEIRRTLFPMMVIIAVLVLAGIIISALLVGVMTQPIRHLGHVADTMSKGDLDTPVSIGIESHGEIGDLARSLERMRSSLKAAMSRFSNG